MGKMTRLIDADKACKAIENARIEKDIYGSLLNEWDHGYNCGLDRAEDDIQDFIVEAIPMEWIPVTERLPQESGPYLVTSSEWYRVGIAEYSTDHRWREEDGWATVKVVAWMPLPEPYMARKEE